MEFSLITSFLFSYFLRVIEGHGWELFFSFPVRCDMIKCDTYYGRRIANCILLWEGGVFLIRYYTVISLHLKFGLRG